jgi:hypothetical protein
MPKPTSKSRQELRSRFVRNAIPTEADFADLIAASLNQADDGVLKLPDQPLGLVRQKPDQPVLRFFADPAAEGSAWQLQLGAGDKPGFGLAAADGKLALFVDGATGNVGIGTTTPGFKLDVNGSVRLGGFTTEEKEEWPNVVWCRDTGKGWDEGLIKHGKEKGFFGRAGFGVHIHESRSFEMFSSGWQTLFGVEGGTGNTSIRGQTTILSSSNPIRFSSKWSSFPDDKTHGAEICNDTDYHKTLMIVGNKSASDTKGPRRVSIWDTLEVNGTLRIQNPVGWGKDGNLALFVDGVTGKVGMGTSGPASKLNIVEPMGTAASANSGTLLLDHEDDGGASSIVFRSKGNRGSDHAYLEFRDKNPLINNGEAALLTIGMQNENNDHIALMPSGNVGVGTTTPTCKLDVNGDSYISGCLGIRAGSEIFFSGHGQIRSLDDSHRILFRKDENKMELREKGDIVFSSGSAEGQETSKMVIHGSGNVGIGSTKPEFKLDVNGTVRLGGFTTEEKDEWPNIVWCRDLAKGWDEGLYKHGKHYGFFGRAGFGVHIHESRSFELFSTNARPLLGVEGGTGNTSIRGNVKVNGCITPSAGNSESTGILFPKDPGGGTGDAAWIRYYVRSNESCTLEIGIANDNDDQLFLNASGGVRCSGTLTQLSDINVKTNISQLPNPLEDLLKLNGVSYAWKRSLSDEPTCLGLIAQEVAEVFPQLVESDHDGFLHLNYLGFIPILIESIKAQQKQLLQIQAAL